METQDVYLIQSLNYRWSRFALTMEEAKDIARDMSREFGGADISTLSYIKGSVKTVCNVRPSVEYTEVKEDA